MCEQACGVFIKYTRVTTSYSMNLMGSESILLVVRLLKHVFAIILKNLFMFCRTILLEVLLQFCDCTFAIGQQNALFTNFSVVDLCHPLAAQVGPLEYVRGNHTDRVT